MKCLKRQSGNIPYFECQSETIVAQQIYLLLHGFEQSKSMDFGGLIEGLCQLGYQVVIPDLDYHGERIKEPFLSGSFDQKVFTMFSLFQNAAMEMSEWLDHHFSHFPTYTVGGFSMGAILALKLASMNSKVRTVHAMNGTPKLENLLRKSHRDWVMNHWTSTQLETYHRFFNEPYLPPFIPQYLQVDYLIQLGEADEYVNMDDNLEFIRTLEKHHHPAMKTLLYPATKHEITPAMVADAIDYFHSKKRTL